MLARLSLRNARRSIRDTVVYFATVVTAVTVFVMFNSLDEQPAWSLARSQTGDLFAQAQTLMTVMSVIVVFVLGFLILFGNRFILRRRAREFGTYLLLGMPARAVSTMIALESLIVGSAALVVGMVLGVAAAQGASAITTGLLGSTAIQQLPFQFPGTALGRTALVFSVIFGVALAGNIVTIKRLPLVSLMTLERQVEKSPFTSPARAVPPAVAGVIAIVSGAVIVLRVGLLNVNPAVLFGLILALIGTALFFSGAGSSFLLIVHRTRTWYLQNLRMFISRQVGAQVASSVVSTTIVTVLLTISAVSLSSGLVLAKAVDTSAQVPYDAVFYNFTSYEDLNQAASNRGLHLGSDIARHISFRNYDSGIPVSRLGIPTEHLSGDARRGLDALQSLSAVSISDYNRLARLQGKPALRLDDHHYAVLSPTAQVVDAVNGNGHRSGSLRIGSETLSPTSPSAHVLDIDNIGTSQSLVRLVVPDQVVSHLPAEFTTIAATFTQTVTIKDAARLSDTLSTGDHLVITRQIAELRAFSVSSLFAYIAIYLGAVLLIAAAAILSIQQLLQATENRRRFGLLRKLGATERDLSRALLIQVAVAFLVPAAAAAVFTTVLLIPVSDVVTYIGGGNTITAAAISSGALGGLYLLYFALAYTGTKIAAGTGRSCN